MFDTYIRVTSGAKLLSDSWAMRNHLSKRAVRQIVDGSALPHFSAQTAPIGVSVVVCCFNSASRLPHAFMRTLSQLASQRISGEIPCELIVVDNASTDQTAKLARRLWPRPSPYPQRVCRERRPGLSFAYERGLNEARYEFVSLIDDDNWVNSDWIENVARAMIAHPEAGAIGSLSEAVCESSPPVWLPQVGNWLALGPQVAHESDVTRTLGALWGAGMSVRKSAWLDLRNAGFRFRLPNRQGESLSTGSDFELCLALRMSGWRLWYDPRLRIRHYMPEQRLKWDYLCRLARGAGEASIELDPYYHFLRKTDQLRPLLKKMLDEFRDTWSAETVFAVCAMSRRIAALACRGREGSVTALEIEYFRGRISKLVQMRRTYRRSMRRMRSARWARTALA